MNDKILVLINSIRRDLDAIDAIYDALEKRSLQDDKDGDTPIVIGYHLHNLYSAFENIFQNVAAVFENSVDDAAQWHSQLLERMRLEVMPLRPALIDDEAYDALDELRRFRHLFRHAYSMKLDPARLQLVLDKAMVLKLVYRRQLEGFTEFLEELV